MSRRRRSNQRGGRDDSLRSLTVSRLPRPEPFLLTFPTPRRRAGAFSFLEDAEQLQEFEDRREFYPAHHPATGYEPARTFFGVPARLVATPPPRKSILGRSRPLRGVYPSVTVAFERPREVLVCVRRSRRREVLHARGVAGRRGLRPPRRNAYSAVSCRR